MKEHTSIGDRIAIIVSRMLATWIFIALLCVGEGSYIAMRHLYEGSVLDVHNLCVSLFTLFIDVIILRAAISLRNLDRALTEKILRSERVILVEVRGLRDDMEAVAAAVNTLKEEGK